MYMKYFFICTTCENKVTMSICAALVVKYLELNLLPAIMHNVC